MDRGACNNFSQIGERERERESKEAFKCSSKIERTTAVNAGIDPNEKGPLPHFFQLSSNELKFEPFLLVHIK